MINAEKVKEDHLMFETIRHYCLFSLILAAICVAASCEENQTYLNDIVEAVKTEKYRYTISVVFVVLVLICA